MSIIWEGVDVLPFRQAEPAVGVAGMERSLLTATHPTRGGERDLITR
ncbi:MAG: hypothetical protein AAB433_16835 [Nitrospirota bacterium]